MRKQTKYLSKCNKLVTNLMPMLIMLSWSHIGKVKLIWYDLVDVVFILESKVGMQLSLQNGRRYFEGLLAYGH